MTILTEIPVSNTLPLHFRATGLPLYLGAGIFMQEIFKPVVGFEDLYAVSNIGRVKSYHKVRGTDERILKHGISTHGYPVIVLCRNKKIKTVAIHILMMQSFVGPRPEGWDICHNDGNPKNNLLSNLRYDTTAGNMADKILHGTTNRGERCASSKLKEKDILEIRSLIGKIPQRELALKYGVCDSTITKIKKNKRWLHI